MGKCVTHAYLHVKENKFISFNNPLFAFALNTIAGNSCPDPVLFKPITFQCSIAQYLNISVQTIIILTKQKHIKLTNKKKRDTLEKGRQSYGKAE